MRSVSKGRPGRQPMTEKRELYVRLMDQGMSNSAACRQLGIDRKTEHWWKNGGVVVRNGVTRVVAPITVPATPPPEVSTRYLSGEERVIIADGVRAGRTSTSIAEELGRAVSTIARERKRNAAVDGGGYRPHVAHKKMLARRPRPKPRRLEVASELRGVVQGYLDRRWSPEQVAHALGVDHGVAIAPETIYQALYSPQRVLQRDPQTTLRTRRPNRRRRRRGDVRLGRFVVPLTLIDDRPDEAVVREWVQAQPFWWADQIRVATIDAFAGCASAMIRDTLPEAVLVVDHFRAIRLASEAVNDVRRRVQQATTGHCGRKGDSLYGIRRLLLTTWRNLNDKVWDRLRAGLPLVIPTVRSRRCGSPASCSPTSTRRTDRRTPDGWLIVSIQHAPNAEVPELLRVVTLHRPLELAHPGTGKLRYAG